VPQKLQRCWQDKRFSDQRGKQWVKSEPLATGTPFEVWDEAPSSPHSAGRIFKHSFISHGFIAIAIPVIIGSCQPGIFSLGHEPE
jgi:hypothetical protein